MARALAFAGAGVSSGLNTARHPKSQLRSQVLLALGFLATTCKAQIKVSLLAGSPALSKTLAASKRLRVVTRHGGMKDGAATAYLEPCPSFGQSGEQRG